MYLTNIIALKYIVCKNTKRAPRNGRVISQALWHLGGRACHPVKQGDIAGSLDTRRSSIRNVDLEACGGDRRGKECSDQQ